MPTTGHDQRTSDLSRTARGSMLNFAGVIVSSLSTFALTVLVARLSSQETAGVFFSATSLFILATSFGLLGSNSGLIYFLSQERAHGRLWRARSLMRTALWPVLSLAVLMGAALFAVAEPLGNWLAPGAESQFATFVRVMAFFVPCAAVLNVSFAGAQGLGSQKVYAGVDQVVRTLLQLVLAAGGILLFGPLGATAWAIAYLPTAILAWWWWRTIRDRLSQQERDDDFHPAGAFWRFSLPRAFAAVTQVAMRRVDIILVGALAGVVEAAVYGALTRFLALGQAAARAVSLSVQPIIGEALTLRERARSQHLYQASTAWLMAITWPLYLTLIVYGDVVLRVFGDEYAEGSGTLALLCGSMLVVTSCGMVSMVLLMGGRSVWSLVDVLLSFAVMITLLVVLVPEWGYLGAGVAWSAGILVGNLLPLAQVAYSLKVHPFGFASLVVAVAAGASFAGVPLLARLAWGATPQGFVVALCVGLFLYAGLVWMARERLELRILLSGMRRRQSR